MRRFKAQGITTSKPKSKQNFICQQTQATYNLYALSNKTLQDKKIQKSGTGNLGKKNTANEANKGLEGGQKGIVLSNSLLIEGSNKNRQGSVLSRLKSRAANKGQECSFASKISSM